MWVVSWHSTRVVRRRWVWLRVVLWAPLSQQYYVSINTYKRSQQIWYSRKGEKESAKNQIDFIVSTQNLKLIVQSWRQNKCISAKLILWVTNVKLLSGHEKILAIFCWAFIRYSPHKSVSRVCRTNNHKKTADSHILPSIETSILKFL